MVAKKKIAVFIRDYGNNERRLIISDLPECVLTEGRYDQANVKEINAIQLELPGHEIDQLIRFKHNK